MKIFILVVLGLIAYAASSALPVMITSFISKEDIKRTFYYCLACSPVNVVWCASIVGYFGNNGIPWQEVMPLALIWGIISSIVGLGAKSIGQNAGVWSSLGLAITPVATLIGIGITYAQSISSPKKKQKCPSCGEDVAKDDQFCQSCGQELENLGTCSECDSNVPQDADFCPSCGAEATTKG